MIEHAVNALDLVNLGSPHGMKRRIRGQLGTFAADTFFHTLAYSFRYHPLTNPWLHGVKAERNIPYGHAHRRQKLDVYRPAHATKKPLPMVFYVHGGGFRSLSKNSHWLLGLIFARHGYVLVNVDYGISPKHRYPDPLKDVFAAYAWAIEHAQSLGACPSQVIVAGESAGANLILALLCAFHYERPESYARALRKVAHAPMMGIPNCGILQVTDIDRYERTGIVNPVYVDLMRVVSDSYFTAESCSHQAATLADPLRILEECEPETSLPPIFASVGRADPLLGDTLRLGQALTKQGVPHQIAQYAGEMHAFQMLIWRKQAMRCWRDTFSFINRHRPVLD